MPTLKLIHIDKYYDNHSVINSFTHSFQDGKITAILGPSGCGKSTLLGIIAGLIKPEGGELFWGENLLNNIPAHRREFGLMFQDYALFPHMDVSENIAFGLKMKKWSSLDILNRTTEVLDLVNLSQFKNRNISTLSGGESQRVALARTLAPNPRLLMLDEPLGSLDRSLREKLTKELYTILRSISLTTIYVTHDQEEAFSLADEIIVMQAGKIRQVGTPKDLYQTPENTFVAKFLGFQNLIPGDAQGDTAMTSVGLIPLPKPTWGKITLLLRPEGLHLDHTQQVKWFGKIIEQKYLGNSCRAVIDVQGNQFNFHFSSNECLPPDQSEVKISFDPKKDLQILLD